MPTPLDKFNNLRLVSKVETRAGTSFAWLVFPCAALSCGIVGRVATRIALSGTPTTVQHIEQLRLHGRKAMCALMFQASFIPHEGCSTPLQVSFLLKGGHLRVQSWYLPLRTSVPT